MRRFADFDEAFAEQTIEPLVIKLFETQWVLPGAMPAAVPLKMMRYGAERGPGESLNDDEVADLAAHLVPADILGAWREQGLTPEQLAPLVMWIVEQLMARERGEPGEAQAPIASSSDGGSSKPISPANTDSSFPSILSA